MANKKMMLVTGEYYHVFNHTVGNELVFNSKRNLDRILSLINFYRFEAPVSFSHFIVQSKEKRKKLWKLISSSPPLVEIYCFAFMPNHYHLLLKQLKDNGIEKFIANFQNSFSKFFNTKNNRKGSLFCHSFDRVLIETEEQFIHVSRYIHLNPVTSYLIEAKELEDFPYTSFPLYVKKNDSEFLNIDFILSHFKTPKRYKEFVLNQSDYQRKLNLIKNLILEKRYKGLKLINP